MKSTVKIGYHFSIALLCIKAGAGIIDNSPFIPAGFQPDAISPSSSIPGTDSPLSSQINFSGYYKLDDTYYFLLKKKDSHSGEWVALRGEVSTGSEVQILQFDEKSERVEVSYNASQGWIELNTEVSFLGSANIRPSGTASSGPAPPGNPARITTARGQIQTAVRNGFLDRPSSDSNPGIPGRAGFSGRNTPFGAFAGLPRETIRSGEGLPGQTRRSNELELEEIPVPQTKGNLFIPDLPDKPPTESPSGPPGKSPIGG